MVRVCPEEQNRTLFNGQLPLPRRPAKEPLKGIFILDFPPFLGHSLLFCCCDNTQTLDSFCLISRSLMHNPESWHTSGSPLPFSHSKSLYLAITYLCYSPATHSCTQLSFRTDSEQGSHVFSSYPVPGTVLTLVVYNCVLIPAIILQSGLYPPHPLFLRSKLRQQPKVTWLA